MEGTCETCGNTYHDVMHITKGERTHTFDSFECAIEAMAPPCAHCGTRVIGHGLEDGDAVYCCRHCARAEA